MARIDEFQVPVEIENSEKHCRVTADFRVVAQKTVYVIEHSRGIRAQCHSGKRALQHGSHNRCAQSFAGNIGKQKRGAPFSDGKYIEIISSHGEARKVASGNVEMRKFPE